MEWNDTKENFFCSQQTKIIDLSERGDQPMKSYSENLVINKGETIIIRIKNKLLEDSNNQIKFKNKTDTEI